MLCSWLCYADSSCRLLLLKHPSRLFSAVAEQRWHCVLPFSFFFFCNIKNQNLQSHRSAQICDSGWNPVHTYLRVNPIKLLGTYFWAIPLSNTSRIPKGKYPRTPCGRGGKVTPPALSCATPLQGPPSSSSATSECLQGKTTEVGAALPHGEHHTRSSAPPVPTPSGMPLLPSRICIGLGTVLLMVREVLFALSANWRGLCFLLGREPEKRKRGSSFWMEYFYLSYINALIFFLKGQNVTASCKSVGQAR